MRNQENSAASKVPHGWAENRRKRWVFRLSAVCLAVVVTIPAMLAVPFIRGCTVPIYVEEPGHEITGHRYLYDQMLGWRNIPNWHAETFGRRLTINSKGLRDREYAVKKPVGTTRILVLGDSFAWGYGVSDEDIFTEVLEAKLNDHNRNYEVLNTGVSGWGTDQEYLYLKQEGLQYSPDVVLLAFFLNNDPTNNLYSIQYGLFKPVFLNENLQLANVPVPKPGEQIPMIFANSDPIDLTLSIIDAIAKACASKDCRFVVMKFGTFLRPQDPKLLEWESRLESRLAPRVDLRYLDLDEEFAAQGYTLEQLLNGNNDGHWNAFGHHKVGLILYKFLLKEKLL